MFRLITHYLVVALLCVCPAVAQAQADGVAPVSVRIVDPVGVGATEAPASRAVVQGKTGATSFEAGAYAALGPQGQVFSVEPAAPSSLARAGAAEPVPLQLRLLRQGDTIRLAAQTAGRLSPGTYSGEIGVMVNYD